MAALKRLISVVILLLPITVRSQIIMPENGIDTVILQPGTSQTIYDPGGTGYYPNDCNGTLVILSAAGTNLYLSGTYQIAYGGDRLYISYDHTLNTNPTTTYYSYNGTITHYSFTSEIVLLFTSNPNNRDEGFVLNVYACDTTGLDVKGVKDTLTGPQSTQISWNGNGTDSIWTLQYGTAMGQLTHSLTTGDTTVTLTDLEPGTPYFYHVFPGTIFVDSLCNNALYQFTTPCAEAPSCIDYTQIGDCHMSVSYGTFANPAAHSGVMNYGSASNLSRITMHTDPNEYDVRTGNQLKTVPDGYEASVRLGNWNTGGEGEQVVYEYQVDTTEYDLLIMKYAAVLQNPDHDEDEQPRFNFSITDSAGQPLNNNCYSAEFVASVSLGWNNVAGNSNVLWKDWTTVGIDLGALHGQTIYIQLTTRDCSRQSHYGYAYYVFDCAKKRLSATSCGETVENTFTAPAGFGYRWYEAAHPQTALGTDATLHVTQAGEYHCVLSFIGAPGNSDCSFELVAQAGTRYPAALYSWEYDSIDSDCMPLPIRLHNNSVVSLDATHTQLTTEPCEGIAWTIDDTLTASGDHPLFWLDPGSHQVRLIAWLSDGACADTLEEEITVTSPCTQFDTLEVSLCEGDTLFYHGALLTEGGTYHFDSLLTRETLLLTLLPVSDTTLYDTIVENELPYPFCNDSLSAAGSSDCVLVGGNGCDSTVHLHLHVWMNSGSESDTAVCGGALPTVWHGVNFTQADTVTVLYSGVHGEDSTATLRLQVLLNSSATLRDTVVENTLPVSAGGCTFHASQADTTLLLQNAAGCDSLLLYSLHVWMNVSGQADSTVCENQLPLAWNGVLFFSDSSASATFSGAGSHGEDSTTDMQLHVLHNSEYTQYDTVVENALPVTFAGTIFPQAVTDTLILLTNAAGCDSLVHYSLHVWHNSHGTLDSTICDSQLPLSWCDTLFTAAGSLTLSYLDRHGADSLMTLTLLVNPTYEITDSSAVCEGDTARYGHTKSGTYDHLLTTTKGCDSLVHLKVTIHPVYLFTHFDTICDNESHPFEGSNYTIMGHYSVTYSTLHGCDSTLELELTVHPTHHEFDHASICDAQSYTWAENGETYYGPTYEPQVTYLNQYGCDSTIQLILDFDTQFQAQMRITPTLVDWQNNTVQLYDISRSGSRLWYLPGGTDSCRNTRFTFPADADSVEVLMVAYSYAGCRDSVTGIVRSDRSVLWVPNAFTPDEETNNLFAIESQDLAGGEVWIYDRKGLVVTHFDLLTGYWDGTHNGAKCPEAAYVWKVRYSTLAQPRIQREQKGTVLLLR